mgnify:FL=1
MAIEILTPKYRRNPNEKVESLYFGVGARGTQVLTLTKPSLDRNHMESTRTYSQGIPRGQGGRIATLILGGMEATLDEVEYILEAHKEKKFQQRRSGGEIADMCRLLIEKRNDRFKFFQKNPSEKPRRRKRRIYLPVGYRYVDTPEPGFKMLAKV